MYTNEKVGYQESIKLVIWVTGWKIGWVQVSKLNTFDLRIKIRCKATSWFKNDVKQF